MKPGPGQQEDNAVAGNQAAAVQHCARVLADFIDATEQTQLIALATNYRERGILESNPAGPGRYRRKVHGTPWCDATIEALATRVIERFGLQGFPVDPYLGWIVSWIEPGARIKPHIDRHPRYRDSTDRHLRCNVLVQGNGESAWPIIGGRATPVAERGVWAFFASEHAHGTLPLAGPLPRIVYQFGFVAPPDYDLDAVR